MIICDSKRCSLVSSYQCSNNPEVPNEFQKNVFVNYKNSFGSKKPSCLALFLQSNALRKPSRIVDKEWSNLPRIEMGARSSDLGTLLKYWLRASGFVKK